MLAPTNPFYLSHFTDAEKKDQWARIVAPINTPGVSSKREDSGPTPVQSPLTLFSTLLSPGTTLPHTFEAGSTKGYIHVIQTSGYNTGSAKGAAIKISGEGEQGTVLKEGDAAYISVNDAKELKVENVGDSVAEILLFELA